jgi:transcription elongation factor Elf1
LNIIDLSEPVDIFAEWVDAIEAQDKQKAARKQRHLQQTTDREMIGDERGDEGKGEQCQRDNEEE